MNNQENPVSKKSPTVSVDTKVELSQEMSLFSITMIGVGAMIGAGIFVLTGLAAGAAGPALILSFLLNGIVTVFTAMVYAELGSTFPSAGGGYVWVRDSLPQPSGFLSGWMDWFAHAVACSLYALGFGAYAYLVINMLNINIPVVSEEFVSKLLGVIIILIFTYINYRGASETGLAGSIVTILKIVILVIFIIAGLISIFKNPTTSLSHFRPFMPEGFTGVLFAMGLTFIAFEGYEIIVQAGEEVKDPKRNIPRAIFTSLLVVVPIYILIAFVGIGGIESLEPTWQFLGKYKELAIVEAARQFFPYGEFVLLIGGLLSTMSALNATIYSSSRVSFSMGRDGSFPKIFARIHPKRRTPFVATFISSILIIAMALALPIHDVASAADIMFLLLFLMVNMAVINLRRTKPLQERGYRMPWFPYIPLLGILTKLFLAIFLFGYSPVAWYTTIIWIVGGVIFYYAYARERYIEKVEEIVKTVHEEKEVVTKEFKAMLPIANPESIKPLIKFAGPIVSYNNGQLTLLNVINIPALLPMGGGRKYIKKSKPIIEKAVSKAEKYDIPLNSIIKISHRTEKAITDTVKNKKIDLLFLGWRGFTRKRDYIFGSVIDPIIANAECDTMVLRVQNNRLGKINKILLPVADIRNTRLSIDMSANIARAFDAKLYLLHIMPPKSTNKSENLKKKIINRLNGVSGIDKENIIIEKSSNIVETILDHSKRYDLLVLNTPSESIFKMFFIGNKIQYIAKNSASAVLLVKKYEGKLKTLLQKFFGTRKIDL
ncbi:MAG: amino acid permease [Actinomycetota bacterium]|nr:MAG: amino acid permease [Actinomycetota bacterium]